MNNTPKIPEAPFQQEQPKVLFPDAKTGTCYSGAMFIDHRDLLERKSGDEDVLVAFYLRTETGLCLAYSNDGAVYVPYVDFPAEDNRSLSATCDVGEANVSTLRIHELKSSWQRD